MNAGAAQPERSTLRFCEKLSKLYGFIGNRISQTPFRVFAFAQFLNETSQKDKIGIPKTNNRVLAHNV